MDGVHDMGGMHGFGAVVRGGGDRAYDEPWEPRSFALSTIVGIERLGKGGGRAIREEMDPVEYLRASYYERWTWSTERRLERKGTIAPGEVDAMVARLAGGEPAPTRSDPEQAARTVAACRTNGPLRRAEETRFPVGARVRVKRMRHDGHTRCPRYLRGATGVVEAIRGTDKFPDIGPYQGPVEPVYAVAFAAADLFGSGTHTVIADLFETYLEPT